MMRVWIIAVAVVACTAGSSLAQDGGGMQHRYQQPQAQAQRQARLHVDPNFRPAAVAAEQARRGRASRPATQQQAANNSGGFFSKLKLPNLIPQSIRGDSDESIDDAPMPYDSADDQPQSQQRPRAAVSSQQQRAPQQRTSPNTAQSNASRQQPAARMAQARSRTAASTAPVRAPQAPARSAQQAPAQRVARSSPTTSTRRNELAEALSGLVPSTQSQAASAPESEELAQDEAIVPPIADESEELPSYLSDSPAIAASKAPRTAVAPRPRTSSQDLRDALLSEDTTEDVVQEEAPESEAAEADEIASDAEEPAIEHGDLVEPPMPSTSLPTPSSRTAANRKSQNAAAAFAGRKPSGKPATPAASSLGEIVADRPNAEVDSKAAASTGSTATIRSQPSANTTRPHRGVLFTSRQPIISSHIEGPQQIVVGRQAEYRVTVQNTGDVAARDLAATIAAPAGAELVDASASNGTVERNEPSPGAGEIRWQLYELPAGASQTLTLQLIPRGGREMQLGVQLTHAPTGGQATVEIQEPKLSMEITGPSDVQFGKSQRYALTLNNPGNGAAEDIVIELTPPGGDKASLVRHKVGTLAPGETKKIELELTARDAGELKIQAAAMAANNLRTEAVKSVLCRKAELQVDWRGADKSYAGSVATYYVRVRNPGTAAAEQVAVKLNLPPGAELVEASDDHEWDADRRVLLWKAANLSAGEERFLEVQCRLSQPGMNKMELSSQTASGDLSDAKSIPVSVEALADLKLEVSDPKGVVPVGENATYEVRIKNRGMTSAKAVNIVAMFSEGIEPSHVEGGQHMIKDGRVSFRAIDLAAGAETVFKIHAKATKSGTHVFRAEVACDELEVKLASEETTRFFNEDQRWADASTAYADEAATQTR